MSRMTKVQEKAAWEAREVERHRLAKESLWVRGAQLAMQQRREQSAIDYFRTHNKDGSIRGEVKP